jgi:hypothetical protein
MKPLLYGAVSGAAITLLLAGCGGNDSGSGPTPPPPTPMTSYVGSTGTLAAWADPTTMTFNMPGMGSYAGKRQFQRGNVDPLTGMDLGQPAGVEIFKGGDGHVYVVDLASTSAPAPLQASTEHSATTDDLCSSTGTVSGGATYDYAGVFFVADVSAPANSTYVYRLPGADGICGTDDDPIHVVKTGMDPTTSPMAAFAMPAATIFSAGGAINGFVAKSGTELVIEDNNLANPVDVGDFPAPIMVASAMPVGLTTGYETGRLFVVDGNIVFVDYNARTTSASLFTIPGWTPTNDHLVTAASPTTLYFAVNVPASPGVAASATLYSMPADGSAAPTLMSTIAGTVSELDFPVNGANVIAAVSGANFSILSWPAAGGASTTLLSTIGTNSGRFGATANDVYYTTWMASVSGATTTHSGTTSGIVDMTGAIVQAAQPDSLYLDGGEADAFAAGDTTTRATPFVTMFQVQGLTPVTVAGPAGGTVFTEDGISGGTLYAIDTSTNASAATLGTFPTSLATSLAAGTYRGIDHVLFLQAVTPMSTQDPATRDLYLINSRASSTLQRVTGNL